MTPQKLNRGGRNFCLPQLMPKMNEGMLFLFIVVGTSARLEK
jgi:hypothetical protein